MKSIKRRNKNIKTKHFYCNLSYKFLTTFKINFPAASLGCMTPAWPAACVSYVSYIGPKSIRVWQHLYLRLFLHSISPLRKATAPPFGLACHFLGMWSLFHTSKKVSSLVVYHSLYFILCSHLKQSEVICLFVYSLLPVSMWTPLGKVLCLSHLLLHLQHLAHSKHRSLCFGLLVY